MNHIVVTFVKAALDVLGLVVIDFFDMMANFSNPFHKLFSEFLIDQKSFVIIANSEFGFFVHRVAVE